MGFAQTWRFFLTVLTPIILIVIPLCWSGGKNGKEAYGAYVIVLMAVYWMTECIPLPITAFLPVILYPLFGIASTDAVTKAYLLDSIFFNFGGCIIALAFEYSNLHSRIALKVILVVGARIPQLLFGIMFTTMFLSMWMNNTSTTAMMVPIVSAIMEEFKRKMLDEAEPDPNQDSSNTAASVEDSVETPSTANLAVRHSRARSSLGIVPLEAFKQKEMIKREIRSLKTMFLLGTAFASNIGGTGVITGSGTNVIALGIIRKDADEPFTPVGCKKFLSISFLDWMLYNIPPMMISTICLWVYMLIHFRGIPKGWRFWKKGFLEAARKEAAIAKSVETSIRATMERKYKELGAMTFHESGVLYLFLGVVILWIFKDPQIIPGWDNLFSRTRTGKSFISEATPTILICVLLCSIPSKKVYYSEWLKGGLMAGVKDPLLSWDFVRDKFPWGIIMLLGGGSAMGVGAKESGLNAWIGLVLESNSFLKQCPDEILLLLIMIMIAILTTVASNTATAAIVTPVLLGLSYVKGLHPLFLVMPAATVCSYAFVLPVSTPPNAIVYSSSDIKLTEMMIPGFLVSIMTLAILFLCTLTAGSWSLDFPGYAGQCENMTLLAG